MPRYFHEIDGREFIHDEETELPSLRGARVESTHLAGSILRDEGEEFRNGEQWHMDVTDASGLSVLKHEAGSPSLMRKRCTSAPCWDTAGNARLGALVGIAVAALNMIYHALSDQIPENLYAHVIGEYVTGALAGAAVFAAVSAIYNWRKRTP